MRYFSKLTALLAIVIPSVLPGAPTGPLVDKYGQYLNEDWPGKIKTDADLKKDAVREAELLKNITPDLQRFDQYGGVKGIGQFKATGFFYISKINGRFFFITPEGNPFFMIGVDAVGHNESGYRTPIQENNSPRQVFTELPSRKEFAAAYQGKDGLMFNFLTANLQRKYGQDFQKNYVARIYRRMLNWGFNSSAKWGWGTSVGMPYIEDGNLGSVRRFGKNFIDPFDPQFAAKAESDVKKITDKHHNNRMLIAYSFENENGWSLQSIDTILQNNDGALAAKAALIEYLLTRNSNHQSAVNILFDQPATTTKEMLLKIPLNSTKIPKDDLKGFLQLASRRYHEILSQLVKKHDPNHLFCAASHCPSQSTEWITEAIRHVDFACFNEYNIDSAWITQLYPYLKQADKPYVITECAFVCDYRGMPPYGTFSTVRTEKDRGLAYRYYTEKNAEQPLCLGFGYFIFYDQPVTMRSLPYGERFNFGLVNQADQPYYEMLKEVKNANAELFDVHSGKKAPFQINGRKLLGNSKTDKLSEIFLSGTTDKDIIFDGTKPEYFNGEQYRLKIDEYSSPVRGLHTAGIIFSGDGIRFTGFKMSAYIWKQANNQNATDWFKIEESEDGKFYTSVPIVSSKSTPGEFNEYILSPQNGLKSGTHYLKINMNVFSPEQSWANQLGKIVLEK